VKLRASLPNLITLFRLLLTPFIVAFTYGKTVPSLAAAVALLGLAIYSDCLDGALARRFHAESRFGKLMDPVVDKVLILSVLFALSDRGLFPLYLPLLLMFREFFITGLRHSLSSPRRAVGANWMGKSKLGFEGAFLALAYTHLILLARGGHGLPGGEALLFWCLVAVVVICFLFLGNFIRWHLQELKAPPDATSE